MFTGLVETQGLLEAIKPERGNRRLLVKAPFFRDGLAIGDSIAHDGVCLTVEAIQGDVFEVVAVAETLQVTTLGDRKPGDLLNLERAMLPHTRMGGHWVQGHVDGVASVVSSRSREGSTEWILRLPAGLSKYCIDRGSICLDGISLTLGSVSASRISVNIIPHTASATTISRWRAGRRVNVEVDVLAKYVEKLLKDKK
ncbi:MAG: riboflavin synthase [Fibrobacteria bacterium]|nr:riboflavin synthase [Fibrobacteria bacterium]